MKTHFPRSTKSNIVAISALAFSGTIFTIANELSKSQLNEIENPYIGSTFEEVRSIVFEDAKVAEIAKVEGHSTFASEAQSDEVSDRQQYENGKMPYYNVRWQDFKKKIGNKVVNLLKQATIRTVEENYDFYPRVEKLVHANGICFTGKWKINEDSGYTGYFAKDKEALFVGRASIAGSKIIFGEQRTMGFAGKLFPTTNPTEKVKTANFVTIDNLGGLSDTRFLDVALTNEPALGFNFTPFLSLSILFAFSAADSKITFRPIDPIASLGVPEGQKIKSPKWMMLQAATGTEKNSDIDIRQELDMKHFPNGLQLNILASDVTKDPTKDGWKQLGQISLSESTVSYGCDRQLHFHHNKVGKSK